MTGTPPTGTGRRRSLLHEPAARSLAVFAVLGFSGFFLTLSSLPSYAVSEGASEGSAGIVTAVMLAATVVVQAVVPALERRLGLTRLLALGLVALAVPAPFYLVNSDLWWLSALSAVRGAGFAVLTVLGALLTTRVAPAHRHGESVGIYGLGIAVPNLVAVPVATALTLSGHFAWVAVAAAAPLLALPVVRSLGAAPHAPVAPEESGSRRDALRAVAAPSFVLFVITLGGGGLLTFLPIARPDGLLAAAVLLVFGAASAVSRWRVGVLLGHQDGRALLAGSLVSAVIGLVAVAAVLRTSGVAAATVLIIGALLVGIGYGAAQNITQVIAFARAGPGHLVAASALWNAAFDAGTAVGSYGVGAIAAAGLGLSGTFVLCAAVLAVAVPLVVSLRPSAR